MTASSPLSSGDDGNPMNMEARILEPCTIDPVRDNLSSEVTVAGPVHLQQPATWAASWKAVAGAAIRGGRRVDSRIDMKISDVEQTQEPRAGTSSLSMRSAN